MIGLATMLGISQFVFVQWVAPFLSEFPEFTSTSYWARSRGKAGMALMNLVSSNINQWTVLAAMIPIVYSFSLGHPAAIPLQPHRNELILTWLQSALGMVLLANFRLEAYEAVGLFLLWLVQAIVPGLARGDQRALRRVAGGGAGLGALAARAPARLPGLPDALEPRPPARSPALTAPPDTAHPGMPPLRGGASWEGPGVSAR